MGRYTQRRRAASGPSPAAAPPSIIDVSPAGLMTALVTFSADCQQTNTFGTPELTIGGFAITGNFWTSPTTVQCSLSGNPNSGDPWVLTAQPNFTTTPVDNPAAGLVT
jgi:hypothetical protein